MTRARTAAWLNSPSGPERGELAAEPLEDAVDQAGDVAGAGSGVASALAAGTVLAGLRVEPVAEVGADQGVDSEQEVGVDGGGGS